MVSRERMSAEHRKLLAASTPKEIQATLWRAADKLRGSIDASQYKELVLGLVFLKYLSDAFDERRNDLVEGLVGEDLTGDPRDDLVEDPANYTGAGVFWVPRTARWSWIAANARNTDAGRVLDAAMDAVMQGNTALAGVLPRVFDRDNIDQKRLAELIDLIGDVRLGGIADGSARDAQGQVYEYLLAQFARAEGMRGGEFHTPRSVARLMVEMLSPQAGRVYDPVCGSASMLTQAAQFGGADPAEGHISVFGQEINERTWRLAMMNLAVHGVRGDHTVRRGDSLSDDQHPGLRADFVMAHPPFNVSDWARDVADSRWKYGVPPASNANFAWLQHVVAKLGDQGTAAVVLTNSSIRSARNAEGEIRQAMVEDDLVACIVALPPQLFHTTRISACLWILAKDKSAQSAKRLADRRGQILFIDAHEMGTAASKRERVLTDANLAKIAGVYLAWRGTDSHYHDEPDFCFSASVATVREHDYALIPGLYIEPASLIAPDPTPGPAGLMRDLYAIFDGRSYR
ncbi:type I restriction-modification system subunit M [Streptomyces rishiriensis]|uniref:type I restriction-modification system subunit M n=1 Tax=Streptomyces rishiriensis TaxID=68264 RepID=UPI000D59AEF0|nr:class I SAM-dependent DNA methyltransferase [Streptomyces rishiriensis]